MIRPATFDDVPRLVALGRIMHAESPRFGALRFDAQILERTLRVAIAEHFAMVALHDGVVVGGMVALLTPHWFSPDLTACDLALFIDPEYRGGMAPVRLLHAYAQWAKASGSRMTLFGVMTAVNTEKTVALAERLGWRRAGVVMEI
jgi:GNAT superfamily N-acetyltransferase